MWFLIDLILLAVVVLFAFIGKKRGFIKTFFSFFGSLISFFLSSLLARPVGDFLASRFLAPAMEGLFLDRLKSSIGSLSELDFSNLPEAARAVLSSFGTSPEQLNAVLSDGASTVGEEAAGAVAAHVVAPIAQGVGFALAFIALFIFFSIAIRVLVSLLNLISKLPFLNFSNRTLGLVVGAVEGLFIAVLLACLLKLFAPYFSESGLPILSEFSVEETYLARFLSGLGLFGQIS